MGKSLVIVESPSKAKIINKYLGDEYIVKASVGHIRDLPISVAKKEKTSKDTKQDKNDALFEKIGVFPNKNWQANYQIMPGKEKVVSELKKLAKDADNIYLATDLDREGEAIAWHLKEILGSKNKKFWRVKYPEITKSAIHKAFDNPSDINMDLVNAQQTRRFLDRIVGFMVSPLLWKKVARGLSAGRVQSVAVELIVDREREIKEFEPQEYWSIDANVNTQGCEQFALSLTTKNGKKIQINNNDEASLIEKELKGNDFIVCKIESKDGKAHALPPFTTSTLQQSANQRLGFSVKKTMTIAQYLYENGLITYMRTDSVNLSEDAINAARAIIEKEFGSKYLPKTPNYYKSKESAQEAHEAIRPSYPEMSADKLPDNIDKDGRRLYELIYRRYLACQMSEQLYKSSSILVNNGSYGLRASGHQVVFDGFKRVWPSQSKEDTYLPNVNVGDKLSLLEILKEQHFTAPPARFSEASLVKELEKDGIGRPSTYAAIIATIQDRGYVKIERGRFYAEKMGEVVTDRLCASFATLMDKHFTAQMELTLDDIADGKKNWIDSLNEFYSSFSQTLQKAQMPAIKGGMPENKTVVIDLKCPQCNKYNMGIHFGSTGAFLSCQGYFDTTVAPKDRCKKTLNLSEIDLNDFSNKNLSEADEVNLLRQRSRCPKCNSMMDSYLINESLKLDVCSNSPTCDGYILYKGDFSSQVNTGPQIECDKCGHQMVLKEGRFGKYMACTNENCKNTRKILKSGEVAPPKEDPIDLPELLCNAKGSHFVLRDGATGIFLAAHNFPKIRETRAPLVKELIRFKDRLPSKFHYLTLAPAEDDMGVATEVRFSRKSKQQYVMSQVNGKPTKFRAFYDAKTNSWQQVQDAEKKAKKTTKKSKE